VLGVYMLSVTTAPLLAASVAASERVPVALVAAAAAVSIAAEPVTTILLASIEFAAILAATIEPSTTRLPSMNCDGASHSSVPLVSSRLYVPETVALLA